MSNYIFRNIHTNSQIKEKRPLNVKENKVELDMGGFRGRKGKKRNDVIILEPQKLKIKISKSI